MQSDDSFKSKSIDDVPYLPNVHRAFEIGHASVEELHDLGHGAHREIRTAEEDLVDEAVRRYGFKVILEPL